jgi:hypothetical protein
VNRFRSALPKPLGRLQNWYRVAASGVFNSLALLVVLNVVLYVVISAKTKPDSPLVRYGKDNILTAYPGWHQDDVKTLLRETYADLKFEYEPFTEFRNKPLRGKFVNIDSAGFRVSKGQAPWPPRPGAFNVFVFGGSTTFGMGLPDEETIASYLTGCAKNSASPVAVYNFGRIFYLSRQEQILFQQLLQAGFVPQVAVFIDGLNDFFYPDGQPGFSPRFRRFMDGQAGSNPLDKVPMVRAANWLTDRWRKPAPQDGETKYSVESVAGRWLANKRMIEVMADGFGVRPIFVWQPVPVYKYDLRYHFLSDATFVRRRGQSINREALMENLWIHGKLGPKRVGDLAAGYTLMETLRAQGKLGQNVLWLADIQENKRENLYVDAVHYTAAFSRDIAGEICSVLSEYPAGQTTTASSAIAGTAACKLCAARLTRPNRSEGSN